MIYIWRFRTRKSEPIFINLCAQNGLIKNQTQLIVGNNLFLSIFEKVRSSPKLNLVVLRNCLAIVLFWIDYDALGNKHFFVADTETLDLEVIEYASFSFEGSIEWSNLLLI